MFSSPLLRLSTSSSPTPFLNGAAPSSTLSFLKFPSSTTSPSSRPPPPPFLTIRAMKKMEGRVVCATNDKTVSVEVTRLAPHPKYKRRVRIKKKYQAHDPENQFKVGDVVQLEESRPISKTKTFLAIPVVRKHRPPAPVGVPEELGIPLQSQQEQEPEPETEPEPEQEQQESST